MKRIARAFFVAAFLLCIASVCATAQCSYHPVLHSQWDCGNGQCYFWECDPGGTSGQFCYQGYGECCGNPSQTANTAFDGSCGCDPTERDACVPDGGLWHQLTCSCSYKSPIVVDTIGEGFHLTSVSAGVRFRFGDAGDPGQVAWTAATSKNGFLVLDRNSNGTIDDATELFGNFTPQPGSDRLNGFAALAVYDEQANGGNHDGILDQKDSIFSHLQLWIDESHDGISQPNELHSLSSLGIDAISLEYREARRTDQFGNVLRYRGVVNPGQPRADANEGRWAYDIFFAVADPVSKGKSTASGTAYSTNCKAASRNQAMKLQDRVLLPETPGDSANQQQNSGGKQ